RKTVTQATRNEAALLVRNDGTFYILDGRTTEWLSSSCITLFIASPRSELYKDFVKQKKAREWYFPVWSSVELISCRNSCYSGLPMTELCERLRIYGGIARYIFDPDYSKIPNGVVPALADLNAVQSVRSLGASTSVFQTTHTLIHIIVSDDGLYQFKCVDIASKYIGEQLWEKHAAQMILNLQEMFGGSPNEISRSLFEIYGHRVFSVGGKTLDCRNLTNGTTSKLTLDGFGGQRMSLERKSLPSKPLTQNYFEPSDDDNFPAIDSLSPQGMFQFTVGADHPIRGVTVLKEICALYDTPPKLYFVVPPHRFKQFTKQKFIATTGQAGVAEIVNLEQYVLELPI
ncbi:hypothetical protein BDR26DRAFT_809484, partial [Obelidium mucronatum]